MSEVEVRGLTHTITFAQSNVELGVTYAIPLVRIPRFPAAGLLAVLVPLPEQVEGAECIHVACQFCVLRLVGLALPKFAHLQLLRRFLHRLGTGEHDYSIQEESLRVA